MDVFVNGRIHTLNPDAPVVEAIACERGRVVALGRSDELRSWARTPREIADLGGRTVIPGLIDAHVHFKSLGLALQRVDLDGASSLAACVEVVARHISDTHSERWLQGRGWNQNDWIERRWPLREDLDAITGDMPAALSSHDGHLLWVNSVALDAAGITATTPDPPGGEIVRDAHGEPTGVLKENATELIYRILPPESDDDIDAALVRATDHALPLGLTGVGNFEEPAVLRSFGRLRERGRLRLRVTQHIAHAALDQALDAGLFTGLGDEWLRVGSLKLFADGTLGSRTAAMLAPFEGSADNMGIAMLSYDAMRDAVLRAADGGIATAIHAIGDRANREALRALSVAPRLSAAPHRIEHAQLLDPADMALFAAHGIVASMQPTHAVGDRDTADLYWGGRCDSAYAWRSLRASGAAIAFGSDAPIETCDPLIGLYAAVRRHRRGDGRQPWRPEQALSLDEALWSYTAGAAHATGEQATKGWLGEGAYPGTVADMVVLSHDIYSGDDNLEAARAICTIVGGVIAAGGL